MSDYSISEIRKNDRYAVSQMDALLKEEGIRRDGNLDYSCGLYDEDYELVGTGSCFGNTLRCLAVSRAHQGEGLMNEIVTHLINVQFARGNTHLFVYTKCSSAKFFADLGFREIVRIEDQVVFMENSWSGFDSYLKKLKEETDRQTASFPEPDSGTAAAVTEAAAIVMNANPFTLGHRYLVDQASLSFRAPEGRRNLTIIPVKEDASRFPYTERLAMIRTGCDGVADVVEGSNYQISAATFPTYFLKDLSDATETQMRLDIDLFGRHIAPALGARVRFVGSEPADPLTARYNALMKELLPKYGVQLVEIQRLACPPDCAEDSSTSPSAPLRMTEEPVTATRVRALLDAGQFKAASALTPASTWPYLLADLAARAMRLELDTPMKPGLVGPDSVGAHKDMDYDVMRKGIAAIRPFFPRMAMAGTPDELRQLGIDAEAAMLAATSGVNTHRGAIFALGLALYRHPIAETAARLDNGSSKRREAGVRGAMQMAKDGYKELFEDWLPYYAGVKSDAYGLQKTLLRIMATLDDTCVIHRVGFERAMAVKDEAKALAGHFELDGLRQMCERYAAEGISPGGAADMLALTILIDSILN